MSKNRTSAAAILVVAVIALVICIAGVGMATVDANALEHHNGWSNPHNPHYVPPCPPTGCIQ